MALLTDGVRFDQPRVKLRIEIARVGETEGVEVIARRERFNTAEAGRFNAPSQDEMTVEPGTAGSQLCEGHANLKGDAGLFREDPDRPDAFEQRDDAVEQIADIWRFVAEVAFKVVEATGVRLIAVGKLATAAVAAPERIHMLVSR